MEGAFETLQSLSDEGYQIAIYGCRANNQQQLDLMQNWIEEKRLEGNFTFPYQIAVGGKPMALAYIDDKGIRFTNWQDIKNYFI